MKPQSVSVDLRIVCAVLGAIIVAMLLIWRPWQVSNTARTIDVVGEASIEAEPDEFQFYPSYQMKGADKAAIQEQLITKVNEVIAKLKELGVEESDITLNSSSYDNFWLDGNQQVTSNSLTITVADKELSQKVQDYLVTTSPDGQLSPVPTFSKETRKTIEADARTKALADAKQKAESTAGELGARIGKVVLVSDIQSGGVVMPYARDMMMQAEGASASSLPVLPGKQDINYTINVTFELR